MPGDSCILTTKDFTILEIMRDGCFEDDPLTPLLERKIESALVVFREDIPVNVATLSSRVKFSIDGRDPDTRILSCEPMASKVEMFLAVTTLRGLSLLGLAERQTFLLVDHEGREERITLQEVHISLKPRAGQGMRWPISPVQRAAGACGIRRFRRSRPFIRLRPRQRFFPR
jgi:regulator of nucleoside diphosphate kinase